MKSWTKTWDRKTETEMEDLKYYRNIQSNQVHF